MFVNMNLLTSFICDPVIVYDMLLLFLTGRSHNYIVVYITCCYWQVILGILFFPSFFFLEFKSKEELQLMPQTMEEHIQSQEDSDSDSNSSTSSDDDREREAESRDIGREVSRGVSLDEMGGGGAGKFGWDGGKFGWDEGGG